MNLIDAKRIIDQAFNGGSDNPYKLPGLALALIVEDYKFGKGNKDTSAYVALIEHACARSYSLSGSAPFGSLYSFQKKEKEIMYKALKELGYGIQQKNKGGGNYGRFGGATTGGSFASAMR